MADEELDDQFAGYSDERREKASGAILGALTKAEREFREWNTVCTTIDEVYGKAGRYGGSGREIDGYAWSDSKLDLFWASFEILKPAVYARPPKPAVKPLFSDNKRLHNVTAELLERASVSTFARTGINEVMCEIRDDLIFTGRGVPWLTYESKDGQKVCVEHLDRTDFLHEPARKWSEVGWVARRAWLTRKEMRARFRKHSGDAYQGAQFMARRDDEDRSDRALTKKAGVWEVWHKADAKVYWVTEGADVLLDSGDPHLKLSDYFPCPRPAYATLQRRSLIPVPDWERYAIHFRKISDLTGRIYLLLDSVRMKGLIPAGGDVGDAIEQLMTSDDDQILVPVPGAALLGGTGGMNGFVQWLPLTELATAIQGLIAARAQLIDDFYQLSGISDIMRGATEAEETLGAQQLKSQYGSVRVRCKIDELQRVAAEMVRIAAEVIAEKFGKDTLLEMAQMEIPSKRDIEQRIKEIEQGAEAELKQLGDKAEEMASQQGEGADPAQAQMMLQQAQQDILSRYAPMLAEAESQVPVEDVMSLLRDDRARSFAFEIETDSTILTDEMQEKQSRNEFVQAFTSASQGLMQMAAMGEPGAKLAGEMMKFVLAPYRAGRQLDSAIDAFIEAAPEMAQAAAGQQGETDALAEANNKLAEAEMVKAKAAMAGVEAKGALDKAEMQRKMFEMQQKAQADQQKSAEAMEKLRQSAEQGDIKLAEAEAKINHLTAQTAEILNRIGLDNRKQELSEYQAAEQSQMQQVDQSLKVEGQQADQQFRERGEERADRQQQFAEQQVPNEGEK